MPSILQFDIIGVCKRPYREDTMADIIIHHNPTKDHIEKLGVTNWPIWVKEASIFPWSYDSKEICYFLEGDVTVTPGGGEPVKVGKGDLVTFPSGMSCTWEIHKNVKKHYSFG